MEEFNSVSMQRQCDARPNSRRLPREDTVMGSLRQLLPVLGRVDEPGVQADDAAPPEDRVEMAVRNPDEPHKPVELHALPTGEAHHLTYDVCAEDT